MRKIHLTLGLVVLMAIAAAGYWVWEGKQTDLERQRVLQLLATADAALRLGMPREGDAASRAATLNEAAARIDDDVTTLRTLPTGRVPELSAVVSAHLDTARELLKRRAHIAALDPRVRTGMAQFRTHMHRRSGIDWTSEAARLKNRLETDYREYQRTIDTHTRLSDGYAEEHSRLTALLPPDHQVPLEEVNTVRDQFATLGSQATVEMEALRRLSAPLS